MKAVMTMFVVAILLCVVLSSEESDALKCTGVKLSDGQLYFSMPYEVNKDINDCDTQWLVDEKVAGIFDAEGENQFAFPIENLTVNAAILKTCPERLECLLICPSANINKKQRCSCDASPLTMLPEVGFPEWSVYIWIGLGASAVLVAVIVIIVFYRKRQRPGYVLSDQGSATTCV